ncbi:MAG: autotransporter outer membrane beta-barrel domain-containing protein [Planctomycetes bacterium]|nr:autotransporter outer membrane beta-barrel domain-containing protein [Planctomycetota bacterium]
MLKCFLDKEGKGVSFLMWRFHIFLLGGICLFACYGTSECKGQAVPVIEDELREFCATRDIFDPTYDDLCLALFPPGLGGVSGAPATTGINAGTLGAQGRAANITARQRRESIEERLDELKSGKNQIKGNVMPDGGERVKKFLKGFGFFVSALYTDTDRDQTTAEIGYDAELKGVMMGVDYRLSDKIVLGIAGGYNTEDADFDRDTGHLDTDSANITIYGNFSPLKNLYVDGYAGYTDINYRSKRAIRVNDFNSISTGHTDGRQYTAGFAAGYDWHYGSFSIGPHAKLDYVNTHINNYSENGNALAMKYADQNIHSTTTNLGFQTSYAQSFSWGVLVPHSRLYWVHQYKNESRDIRSSMVDTGIPISTRLNTDSPDRNYMNFGAGVSAVLPHGVQLFADYDTIFSHEYLHIWTATAGFRMEF